MHGRRETASRVQVRRGLDLHRPWQRRPTRELYRNPGRLKKFRSARDRKPGDGEGLPHAECVHVHVKDTKLRNPQAVPQFLLLTTRGGRAC